MYIRIDVLLRNLWRRCRALMPEGLLMRLDRFPSAPGFQASVALASADRCSHQGEPTRAQLDRSLFDVGRVPLERHGVVQEKPSSRHMRVGAQGGGET